MAGTTDGDATMGGAGIVVGTTVGVGIMVGTMDVVGTMVITTDGIMVGVTPIMVVVGTMVITTDIIMAITTDIGMDFMMAVDLMEEETHISMAQEAQ